MGKSEGNSETWLVTYSDLVTLLLVFFVLLYTLTPGVEDSTFNSFIQYFQKNSSFFKENAVSVQSVNNQEESEEYTEQKMERMKAFIDYLEEEKLESEVNIQFTSDGIKITLSDSLTFESGSSELLPKAKEVLQKVGTTIDKGILKVEVQGHTDNVPVASTSKHESNWHLGAARAVSVVQHLQLNAAIEPKRFKATSFGEYNPITENKTPQGRRSNRRVEIYLRDRITPRRLNPAVSVPDLSSIQIN
ncbi:MAG: hypothetical protein FH748_00775 [Balneolaceae bacterium]|nr:hypothetical protein [Balneolaceae bacterium]